MTTSNKLAWNGVKSKYYIATVCKRYNVSKTHHGELVTKYSAWALNPKEKQAKAVCLGIYDNAEAAKQKCETHLIGGEA